MLTKENRFTLPVQWKFPETKKYAFTFIALFVALFLIYSNSFQGDWHFDDFVNIVKNPYIQIKSFTWEEISKCAYGLDQKRIARPLSYLSFALNYYFDGTNVFGYHVVNFIIHFLAAVFLFLLIYNTLKLPLLRDRYENIAYPLAALATFFWAINPLLVTSVSYIVQRMASMAGMFYIMSMYFYLKGRTSGKLSLSIVFFIISFVGGAASVLTKENSVMLPVSILLFDLLLIQGVSKDSVKKLIKIIILPIIIILFFGLIYTGGFSNAFGGYELRDFTMMQRLLTEPRVILFYLSLLFYPINSRLTLLYGIDVSHSLFQPWTTIPSILLIIALIGIAIYIIKKRPLISFCIIFYFLNHLIEGSVFSLELLYEHRNYIPAMFLFIMPAEFCLFALNYFSYKKAIQFFISFGIILILFGFGDTTYRRNIIFCNDDKLWLDNITKYPNLSRPYSNLGNTYIAYGLREKGLEVYNKAMSINNFANTDIRAIHEYNLGLYYFDERKLDKALTYFEKSSIILPDYLPNTIHIAKIKLLNGNNAEAGHLIEMKLKKYPTNPELLDLFSLILFKDGNLTQSEEFAKKALKSNPTAASPLVILAEIACKKGNYQGAIIFWNLYKKLAPLSSYANLALIELYAETNNKKMLNEEIANLNCYRGTKDIHEYINDLQKDTNISVHVPDTHKIIAIVNAKSNH
jgi:protein O-mannosyl-transferase